jgi:hypothetical protein
VAVKIYTRRDTSASSDLETSDGNLMRKHRQKAKWLGLDRERREHRLWWWNRLATRGGGQTWIRCCTNPTELNPKASLLRFGAMVAKNTGKIKVHNGIQKSKIPIEINKVHNQFMEVTVLPPSFNYWNENLIHGTLSLI